MHPAPSVIVFTVLSGLGFGLMAWLGLGIPAVEGWVAGTFAAMAFGLAAVGLVASTFHLGNPQRAWRALSQWRTSWLSREGVAAVAALAAFGLYGLLWATGQRIAPLGWLASALAIAAVVCTSMIYAQLRTVPRWNAASTPALFLGYAAAGGAMLASATTLAAILLVLVWALQLWAWRAGDRAYADAGSTTGTATGLAPLGRVRLLEAPHSAPNYLMKEMVFVVGRDRARALRIVAAALGGAVPAAILLALEHLPAKHAMAGVAVLSHIVGVLAQRWLFFAEAEHVVGLYYGRAPG